MIAFILGALACAVLYTFFPALAAKPSAWLRAAWARLHADKTQPVVTIPADKSNPTHE